MKIKLQSTIEIKKSDFPNVHKEEMKDLAQGIYDHYIQQAKDDIIELFKQENKNNGGVKNE